MRIKAYGCIAIVLLAGCTATQVRWDATNIRKEVMVYYNDQIMDNLIRAKKHLPFVHVDITLLTSTGASQISGTIGAGENRTSTKTSRSSSMINALGTLSRAVTHPFAYSVTPQQTETLTISAAPALGAKALASPTPTPTESPTPTPKGTWEETKRTTETETTSQAGERTLKKKEETFKPAPTPTPITIYKLYEDFAFRYVKESPIRPSENEYVPGTLKKWGTQYYYISHRWDVKAKKDINQLAYYNFCKALFTAGQAGSLEAELGEIKAATAISATP